MIIKQGASGSIVEVIKKNNQKKVLKYTYINPLKLEEQYAWLNHYSNKISAPEVSNPLKIKNYYYSYEMPFYENHLPLFNYLEKNKNDKFIGIFDKITHELSTKLHNQNECSISMDLVEHYFDESILQKLLHCEVINNKVSGLFRQNEIIINANSYDGIPILLKKIVSNERIAKLLLSRNNISIHGDLTSENILIDSQGGFVLLDPNPTNIISNNAVEVAKLFQSFHSGYEFMDTMEVALINEKEFNLKISNVPKFYEETYKQLFNHLLKQSGENFILEVLFHETVHLARAMPYKMCKSENDFVVIFLTFIIRMNEVLRMF